jgi:hypothetical protein
MAKRKRENSEKSIKSKIENGRGRGRLADYVPWIKIQDVASKGYPQESKVGQQEESIIFYPS